MSDLTTRVKAWRERADSLILSRKTKHAQLKEARKTLIESENEFDAAEEAQHIVQVVAETIQEEAHKRIAGVVTRCLAAVFDEPYEFRIEFNRARGRTEADLLFYREGKKVDPLTASGGGMVDVAAFALRLSSLMLSRPARRRVVVMDEPFRFIKPKNFPAVCSMLEWLARDLETQFVMVTNLDALQCGHVVEVE